MELFLNLTWLVVSIGLGAMFIATRRRCEAGSGKCVYARSAAWVSYLILIAMLLPAISMTDDLMAMVTPSDGEQIARRYEVSVGGQHHAGLHVALLQVARAAFDAPLAFLGNLETKPALNIFALPPQQLPQDRAPPLVA